MLAYREHRVVAQHVQETGGKYQVQVDGLRAAIPAVQRAPERITEYAKRWGTLQLALLANLQLDTRQFSDATVQAAALRIQLQK